MKRGTKVWVIIAAVLFLIGATIIVGDLIMVKFDFSKLATIRCETNTDQTYQFRQKQGISYFCLQTVKRQKWFARKMKN